MDSDIKWRDPCQPVIKLNAKIVHNLTNSWWDINQIWSPKIVFNSRLSETVTHYLYKDKGLGIMKMTQPTMEGLINKSGINAIDKVGRWWANNKGFETAMDTT